MGAETITFWGHPQCLFGDSFVVFLRHCGGTFSPSPPVICTTCQSVAPEAKKKCLLRYVGGVVPFSKPCDVKTGFVTASFHPTPLSFSKGEGGCTVFGVVVVVFLLLLLLLFLLRHFRGGLLLLPFRLLFLSVAATASFCCCLTPKGENAATMGSPKTARNSATRFFCR